MSKIVKTFAIDEATRVLLTDQAQVEFFINDAVEN
jgi:hypothetical protein